MTEEVKKESAEVVVNPAVPDKVTLVIDPVSVPLKLIDDAANAIAKSANKTGKKIKKWFK